jgi:hypothetical protein
LCDLGVDKAAKAQAMVGAHHRQSDAGIARAGFYNQGVGIDLPGLQCPFNDGDTGAVLGTTPWIHALQFCEAVKMCGPEDSFQRDKWSFPNGPEYPARDIEVIDSSLWNRSSRVKFAGACLVRLARWIYKGH